MTEVINDPEFLQSVLEGLPGVDPQSEAIRSAMGQLTQPKDESKKGDKKKDEKKQDNALCQMRDTLDKLMTVLQYVFCRVTI